METPRRLRGGLFLALTMKMSPARRVLFAVALAAAVIGLMMMLDGFHAGAIPIDPLVLRFPLGPRMARRHGLAPA